MTHDENMGWLLNNGFFIDYENGHYRLKEKFCTFESTDVNNGVLYSKSTYWATRHGSKKFKAVGNSDEELVKDMVRLVSNRLFSACISMEQS